MLEQFIEKRFNRSSQLVIKQASEIIGEYQAQGFTLTLRQLYYQFVARGLIANTQQSYKRLGQIVSDARMAGLIDWNAIEDRTRNLTTHYHYADAGAAVETTANRFGLDKWRNQDHRVEVWIEKEALVGVIANVCAELDIDYFACRGYVSQSEQWRAGKRLERYRRLGQHPVILHFGDHDPSGLDMTRDNTDRLTQFARMPWGADVKRLALNMDQVEEHEPPPNPAKVTDSRYEGYVVEYGEESWELDALEPSLIEGLIRDATLAYRDEDRWKEMVNLEEEQQDILEDIGERWEEVAEWLKNN